MPTMLRRFSSIGFAAPACAFAVIAALAACGKDETTPSAAKAGMPAPADSAAAPAKAAATTAAPVAPAAPAASATAAAAAGGGAGCKHAACADNFFVDTQAPSECAVGSTCDLTVKLTALGDFHVNDEYPYRFKANDVSGIDYAGTDAMGKGVFSKPAGDWKKADAKSGVMTVKFTPREKGDKTITGTFKMSVCSAANCLLEQRELSAVVAAH
jgi:hypothetical protein